MVPPHLSNVAAVGGSQQGKGTNMKLSISTIALLAVLPAAAFAQDATTDLDDVFDEEIIDIDFQEEIVDDINGDDNDIDVDITSRVVNNTDIITNTFDISTGIAADLSEVVAGTVLSATATNVAAIDGSVVLDAIGQSGSTTSSDLADSTSNAASEASSSATSATAGVSGSADSIEIYDLGGATGLQLDALFDTPALSNASESASNAASSASAKTSEAAAATTQSFGDVATVAAGALNTADFTVAEAAGSTGATAAGSTATTVSESTEDLMTGSGLLAMGDAMNTATINGSVSARLEGGDVVFNSINTVAAGALNTVTVDASVVGQTVPRIRID